MKKGEFNFDCESFSQESMGKSTAMHKTEDVLYLIFGHIF